MCPLFIRKGRVQFFTNAALRVVDIIYYCIYYLRYVGLMVAIVTVVTCAVAACRCTTAGTLRRLICLTAFW